MEEDISLKADSIKDPPAYCDWCMKEIERRSSLRLLLSGANYCSRGCFYARNYGKSLTVGALAILFAIGFPLIVLAPYPGDITPFLGYFTQVYIVFGAMSLVFFYLAYRGRTVRRDRPEKSRIGS